jgi:hypothetical protein
MPRWQALMNISLPRKGDVDKQTDLITTGDTFEADETRVQNLLNPKFGPPRIRKIEEQSQPLPKILPRMVSNRQFGAPVGTRPDPAGSSNVQVLEKIPELTEPQPDSEQKPVEEAVDIPPRRVRAQAAKGTG